MEADQKLRINVELIQYILRFLISSSREFSTIVVSTLEDSIFIARCIIADSNPQHTPNNTLRVAFWYVLNRTLVLLDCIFVLFGLHFSTLRIVAFYQLSVLLGTSYFSTFRIAF